jgi:hypothetical protein
MDQRLRRGVLLASALVLAASLGGTACSETTRSVGPNAGAPAPLQTTVPGEYIVTLARGADIKVVTALYGRFRIKDIRDLGNNAFLMVLTDDPGLPALEELSKQDARIKAIQPNFVYHGSGPGSIQ